MMISTPFLLPIPSFSSSFCIVSLFFPSIAEKVEELTKMTSGREESMGGLRAWSNYTVTVSAVTRAGAGVSSPDLVCTTREDGQ